MAKKASAGKTATKTTPAKAKAEKKTEEVSLTADDFKDFANAPFYVEVRGEIYKVRALPMGEIPKLAKLMERLADVDMSNPQTIDPAQLQIFAEIIRIGIKTDHPKMAVAQILKKMPLGAFPDFLVAVMDSNDFFGKMQDYYRLAANQSLVLGFPNISRTPPDDSDS